MARLVDPDAEPARVAVKKPSRAGSATPWVLLVFTAGVGAFAVYDMVGRVKTQKTRAEEAETNVEKARQRLADLEREHVALEAAAAAERSKHQEEVAALRKELENTSEEARRAAERAEKADALAADLEKSIAKGEGELIRSQGRLTLNLLDKVLFPLGKADLTPQGKKVLMRVGESLNRYPDRQIWVIGHTDDVPVGKLSEWQSNWELSTARALTVVHFLQDEAKVDPRRLTAAGMGEYRPVSRRNKARNRRIEIVLFPRDVQIVED